MGFLGGQITGAHFGALIALMIGGCLPGTCGAEPAQTQADVAAMKSLDAFLAEFDRDLGDGVMAAFVDLNGDGQPEAIVHLAGSGWCGSGGCETLILVRDGDSWRLLTMIAITNPPIRVLARRSNGYRSIGVWVQGGGTHPGYEAELRFDGKAYPSNPTVPPARPLTGKAAGKTIIAPGR